MINIETYKAAKSGHAKAKQVKPEKLLKLVNKALKKAGSPEDKGQYAAIKDLIDTNAVVALKKVFGETEYVSAKDMRWNLINSYNHGQKSKSKK